MASQEQLAFLRGMVVPAQLSTHRWGVPASVTLAQCVLESAWGQSQLARRCNNYFGVKAVSGSAYMQFTTREVVLGRSTMELANFARYPSAIESFDAHARLLATLDRYKPAMRAAAAHDIPAFCIQLHLDGYSTDPEYPTELMGLIRQHDLTQYDLSPLPDPAAVAPQQEAA